MDHPGLLARHEAADRRGRIPDVADDARTDCLREVRPRHVDLSRLVVGALLRGVGALGKLDDPPAPLENRRLLEVDLALDVLADRRAVDLALEVEHAMAVVLDDGHVVLR